MIDNIRAQSSRDSGNNPVIVGSAQRESTLSNLEDLTERFRNQAEVQQRNLQHTVELTQSLHPTRIERIATVKKAAIVSSLAIVGLVVYKLFKVGL